MHKLFVIGIGAGDPRHVTVQAIEGLRQVDTFFVLDKGATKQELVDVRSAILADQCNHPFDIVEIPDPPRDRSPADYPAEVDRWHAARAAALRSAFDTARGVGAILVWGDPSLYDSTLRVVERSGYEGDVEVIPGITAIQALCAAHRIVLNQIGAPVLITTGRRLRARWPAECDDVAVMLDADCAFLEFDDAIHIWWGAYLGMPDQRLISGTIGNVGHLIARERAQLRERKGWIMDTYLLRR